MFDTDTRPRTSRVDTGWISETQAEICVLGAAMTHTRARLLARIDAFTATVLAPDVLAPGFNAPAGALTEPNGSSMPRVRPELVLHRRIGQPNSKTTPYCHPPRRHVDSDDSSSNATATANTRAATTPTTSIHRERHWTKGGRTDLNNLKPYCHHHHKQHHATSTTGYEPS